MTHTGVTVGRQPFFNGAYVPTGAVGMLGLTISAAPDRRPRPLIATLRWERLTDVPEAPDDRILLELTNLRALGTLSPTALEAALEAVSGWMTRALGPLALDGTTEIFFDDPRAAELWGASPIGRLGTTTR